MGIGGRRLFDVGVHPRYTSLIHPRKGEACLTGGIEGAVKLSREGGSIGFVSANLEMWIPCLQYLCFAVTLSQWWTTLLHHDVGQSPLLRP